MSAKRLTPAVSLSARLFVAGGVWTAVGVMLVAWAASWLLTAPRTWAIVFGVTGVGIGLVAWRALFSRLAADNITRLLTRPARACVFGFTASKGWLITASMIGLGTILRHSDLPRLWLAVPYAAIGVALFLASLKYYAYLATTSDGATL